MTATTLTRWGGPGLMLGAVMFGLFRFLFMAATGEVSLGLADTRFRPPAATPLVTLTLGFIIVGFAGWIIGVLALYVRYRPRAGHLGRGGLMILVVGIALLALSHSAIILFVLVGNAVYGTTWLTTLSAVMFLGIFLGAILLSIGLIVFGIDAVTTRILPRWNLAPIVTGILGILFLFSFRAGPEVFMAVRMMFALGWLLLAYVLWTDRETRAVAIEPQPLQASVPAASPADAP